MRHSKRLTPKGYFGAGSAREMVSTLLQLGQTVYQRELVFPYRNASVAGGWGGDQQVNGILKAPSVCNRSAVKKSTQRKVPRCRRKSRFHHRPCIKTESQIQAYRQPVSLSLPSSNFFFFFSVAPITSCPYRPALSLAELRAGVAARLWQPRARDAGHVS